jgi:hypothetical protein
MLLMHNIGIYKTYLADSNPLNTSVTSAMLAQARIGKNLMPLCEKLFIHSLN